MKKSIFRMLLFAACFTACFSGCRRKPVETETQSETESQTQSETSKATETQQQSETKKQAETQKQSEKKKQTTVKTPTVSVPQTQTTEAVQTPTTEPPSQQCPYCGNWYYTSLYADGTSDYSNHVAAEEQNAFNDSDSTQYYTGDDGTEYAQCPYCFQWFSTLPDASGYTPYGEHIAAESAYAAQQAQEEYYQCPNCGNWVTASEYQDHITNGW